jgi:glycosyltransferase involved in cell wall biosynthesis
LSERGHEVTLVTLDDGKNDRHDVAASVTRICLDRMRPSRNPISGLLANLGRVVALRRTLSKSRPEVVLSFCDSTNVLTLASTIGWSVPVVVSERSDPAAQRLARPWQWLRQRLYRKAARVIVLTEAAARIVAPWCSTPPIVIASAVDSPPDPVHESDVDLVKAPTGGRPPIVLGIGRLEIEKGFDQLLIAFATVAARHPDWRLVIYGEGSLRGELERLRDGLGLRDRVDLPGWVRPIWPAIRGGELFVLPSRYEGFPSALLEAMACGLASVAFACPSGPSAIIRDGVDGLLVPPGDTDALAIAIDKCIGDPVLRVELGRAAMGVTGRFGWAAMTDAYEKVLKGG